MVIETCLTCENRYWCQRMQDNTCIRYKRDYIWFLINEDKDETRPE